MSKTLGQVLSPFAREQPAFIGRVVDALVGEGFSLDLGPMLPDARVEAAAQDKAIAAKLDERTELDRKR